MASQPISIHYQQMEEWLEDRKSLFSRKYRTEYTELLCIAPKLLQVAQYDIPALEKQMKKNETAIKECLRVCEEAQRTQLKLREKRSLMLREYGMELSVTEAGTDVIAAVDQRVSSACVKLNSSFRKYVCTHLGVFRDDYNTLLANTATDYYGADPFALHFPWHQRAFDEAEYAPVDQAFEALNVGGEEADVTRPCIDWGDSENEAASASAEVPETVVEINWDATDMEAHPQVYDSLPDTDGVHFSIDLASARHRVNVVAELEALLCFCRERGSVGLVECAKEGEVLRSLLSDSKEGELARMRENHRARGNFIKSVDRFEEQIAVAKSRSATHQAKMCDTEDELGKLKPLYDELLSRLRGLRDEAQRYLGHMFPEREILILGDLNKYLA